MPYLSLEITCTDSVLRSEIEVFEIISIYLSIWIKPLVLVMKYIIKGATFVAGYWIIDDNTEQRIPYSESPELERTFRRIRAHL